MKRILLLLTFWLIMLTASSCVAVRYPEDYSEWPEERRSEWREQHRLRPWEHYENRQEEHEERDRIEERR